MDEAQLRRELAAAHRLSVIYESDELVWNHISAVLPDGNILVTPGERLWDEIAPEHLQKSSNNVTADIIHKAVYQARPDVKAVVHWHTPAAVAVACLEGGFRCLAQDSAPFYERVAYHDWEGISDDADECERLAAAVRGNANILLMRNHGFCALGGSVAEAWVLAFYFESSCRLQLDVLSTRQEINVADDAVFRRARAQLELPEFRPGNIEWAALLRLANESAGRPRRRARKMLPGGPKGVDASLALERKDEQALRIELAEAHNLIALYGMDQLVWNHISTRLPDGEGILITPGNMMYHEIKPEDLLRSSKNVTADILHSAVYDACPEIGAVMHFHTPAALAVSCLKNGLSILAQHGAYFVDRVAYHEWEGVSDDPAECSRISAAVSAGAKVLVLRNHGFMTFGASIREAWVLAYYFEKTCETQLLVLKSGQAPRIPDQKALEHAAEQSYLPGFAPGDSEWAALRRLAQHGLQSSL
eukprot:TRINITY_DN14385_c0_g1_i5.p1 TRINITY_DN14385_c0_g1~~TRINITY_DN14385_c0_g1_i5.p1  ORF type:complete len:492 (+),score=112.45 TRINITY_DN14385_c0_g1_i5:51-1478(+)